MVNGVEEKPFYWCVVFFFKSAALFIMIKVPPTILPLLKSPQPYIILISIESRESSKREKKGLKMLQSVGVKPHEEGVQSVLRVS